MKNTRSRAGSQDATGSAKYCDDPENCGYADCPTAFCDRDPKYRIRADGSRYVETESPNAVRSTTEATHE